MASRRSHLHGADVSPDVCSEGGKPGAQVGVAWGHRGHHPGQRSHTLRSAGYAEEA